MVISDRNYMYDLFLVRYVYIMKDHVMFDLKFHPAGSECRGKCKTFLPSP